MNPTHPSFLSRIAIAIGSFFAILGNGRLASDITRLRAGEALAADVPPAAAKEVRIARRRGISVLGVFTGHEQDLDAEKHIYGKDFIFTRNINHFAEIVTTYLKRIITN